MVKPEKLYARLLQNRSSIRFRDFQRVLEAFGFELDRTKGSHHQYRHAKATRPLSIQPVGNMAKPYQIDQFVAIVAEFGLTMDE